MMGGCILIFSSLVALEAVSKGTGDKIFNYLAPSIDALVRWLPVFFVLGMAMLPLYPIKFGNAANTLKILCMTSLGFFFTIATTDYYVLGVRAIQGKVDDNNKKPYQTQVNKVITKEKKKFAIFSKQILKFIIIIKNIWCIIIFINKDWIY